MRMTPISQAIAVILNADPTLDSRQVHARVLAECPALKNEVETLPWATFVSRVNSVKARGKNKDNKTLPKPTTKQPANAIEKFEIACTFYERCGLNEGFAKDLLKWLEKVSVDELRAGMQLRSELIASAGSLEKARAILEVMKKNEMV